MNRAAIAIAMLAVVLSATVTRTRATSAVPAEPAPIDIGSVRGLPLGLRWPAGDALQPVIRAIAADIDDDGDLDIVANQGSTDLAVWLNDGTGRLTRAVAPQTSGGGLFAGNPAVADPLPGTPVPATTALPVFDAAERFMAAPLSGGGTTTGPPAFSIRSHSTTGCTPRAPPLETRS